MTSLLNVIKIYQLVQKLLGGDTQTEDRQTGDLISLNLLFKESRLKIKTIVFSGCCAKLHDVKIRRLRTFSRYALYRIPETVGMPNVIFVTYGRI
jgi:hypothetical protein